MPCGIYSNCHIGQSNVCHAVQYSVCPVDQYNIVLQVNLVTVIFYVGLM